MVSADINVFMIGGGKVQGCEGVILSTGHNPKSTKIRIESFRSRRERDDRRVLVLNSSQRSRRSLREKFLFSP